MKEYNSDKIIYEILEHGDRSRNERKSDPVFGHVQKPFSGKRHCVEGLKFRIDYQIPKHFTLLHCMLSLQQSIIHWQEVQTNV